MSACFFATRLVTQSSHSPHTRARDMSCWLSALHSNQRTRAIYEKPKINNCEELVVTHTSDGSLSTRPTNQDDQGRERRHPPGAETRSVGSGATHGPRRVHGGGSIGGPLGRRRLHRAVPDCRLRVHARTHALNSTHSSRIVFHCIRSTTVKRRLPVVSYTRGQHMVYTWCITRTDIGGERCDDFQKQRE